MFRLVMGRIEEDGTMCDHISLMSTVEEVEPRAE